MKQDETQESKSTKKEKGISRRKMLATSMTALAGAATLGGGQLLAAEKGREEGNPKVNFSLKGKSAIVTGAARGIGRAIAVALAEAGADIMAIDIATTASPAVIYAPASKADLDETGRLVRAHKARYISMAADIRDIVALRAAFDTAQKEFGKIDIVVADAGIQVYSSLADMTDQQWNDVIQVNLTGTANTIRAALPHMLPSKSGRIILIASGQGKHGMRDGAAYSASKWGIIGLMKSAALELGEHEITVNSVEPGLVDTAMTRNPGRWKEALKEAGKPAKDNPTEEEVIAARLPTAVMKIPWMQPEDIAPVVVFLASDAANRITGASYDVTAGDSAKYTA